MTDGIKQVAPYPTALRSLVERLSYKQGWRFTLIDDLDRGQGSEGMTLIININVPDSYDPSRMFFVNHYMIVPAASYDERSWQRWLFEQVILVERHEAAEFFMVDDSRPYAPNHGPGNDPYVVRELGALVDAQTDRLGTKRDVKV